jgi:hypothetical protein
MTNKKKINPSLRKYFFGDIEKIMANYHLEFSKPERHYKMPDVSVSGNMNIEIMLYIPV